MSSPHVIRMELPPSSPRICDIIVKAGLLSTLGEQLQNIFPLKSKIFVVTDAGVSKLYLSQVMDGLKAVGFTAFSHIIPGGENSKSLQQAQELYTAAMAVGLDRHDAMLALGGGVVGDLTGFCASTYYRGVPVIQVPTTLLAQVDSAIGGKTAVNAGDIKNGVGTFHQPRAVMIDPILLGTLSDRERAAGMGEVIKYALIERSCMEAASLKAPSESLWDCLKRQVASEGLSVATDPDILRRCAQLKATVVCQDELETKGLRFFLNLGHTFGHAYESLSHYGFLHGEAVALGMMKAVQLAEKLGQAPKGLAADLHSMLIDLGLSDVLKKAEAYDSEDLLSKMRLDKKNQHGNIRLILPTFTLGIVEARSDVSDLFILEVLRQKH